MIVVISCDKCHVIVVISCDKYHVIVAYFHADLSVVEEASPLDPQPSIGDHTHSRTFPLTLNVNRAGSLDDDGPEEHTGYIGNSRFGLSAMGGRPTHRRLGSWSQASNGTSPTSTHRRQQSLVSGQSSKSTSAYSTLSERSTAGSMEEGGGEVDSMYGSLRGRPAMASSTSSRVEQSRVNPHAVIENLFSIGNVSHHEEAELVDQDQGGLKIYVDRNLGTITLAGPHLDRCVCVCVRATNMNLELAKSHLVTLYVM